MYFVCQKIRDNMSSLAKKVFVSKVHFFYLKIDEKSNLKIHFSIPKLPQLAAVLGFRR